MATLLATAALVMTSLLPVPGPPELPILPPPPSEEQASDPLVVSGQVAAADGRLRKGCKTYAYTYAVTTPTDDWTLEITVRDRRDRGVNAQALLGGSDAASGTITYRLCRWATVPGLFTISGRLIGYDGYDSAETTLTDTFRLRRTRSGSR
jgi:hypothetical protein